MIIISLISEARTVWLIHYIDAHCVRHSSHSNTAIPRNSSQKIISSVRCERVNNVYTKIFLEYSEYLWAVLISLKESSERFCSVTKPFGLISQLSVTAGGEFYDSEAANDEIPLHFLNTLAHVCS